MPAGLVDKKGGVRAWRNLRRKLDPSDNRRFIANVRSVGFTLNADS